MGPRQRNMDFVDPTIDSTITSTSTATDHQFDEHDEFENDDDDDDEPLEQERAACRSSSAAASSYYYHFLTAQAAQNLHGFEYQGEDRSLLYRYILAPWANFCVHQLTPAWVPPNAITAAGLTLMLVAYGLMWYYDPLLLSSDDDDNVLENNSTGSDDGILVPRWVFLYNAIAILVYQTLDNMDGRQARRTGSGSPLGLLFDHGCDAVNNIFGSANWMLAMAMNPRDEPVGAAVMVFVPYAMFFIGTWEEYHTGALIMPIINGPSEGLLGGALVSLAAWYYGPRIWQETTVWDSLMEPLLPLQQQQEQVVALRNADIIVLLSILGCVREVIVKVTTTASRFGPGQALPRLIPFVTLLACFLLVGPDVWLAMPRTSLHLCAALFCDMTTDLMLAHITDQPYNCALVWDTESRRPGRWILLPLVFLTFMVVCTGQMTAGDDLTNNYLLVYTTAALTYFCDKTVLVLHEVAHALQIWIFDIVTPRCDGNSNSNTNKRL